jgi:hypothetical protein
LRPTAPRNADLLEAGLQVVRLSWRRLTTQPEREAARFRTLLGAFPGA